MGEEEGTIRSIGVRNRVPEAGKTGVQKALLLGDRVIKV